MAGRRDATVASRATEEVKELPRRAAWLLSKVLRPDGESGSDTGVAETVVDKGRQVLHRASSAMSTTGSDRGVEILLRRAEEAAEAADDAEAEAIERAEEAKRTADEAQRVADEAAARLTQAEEEGKQSIEARVENATREGEELVRRARKQAAEHVEEVREDATRDVQSALEALRADLDDDVTDHRERAQQAAAEAQAALADADEAVAKARELAAQARKAAEEAAAEAARTADRLSWEDREPTTTAPKPSKRVLANRTKTELLDLAATAEVPGRSHMTKAQLVNALAGAGSSS